MGQRVLLPCDIEAVQDDSPLRISWFKDGQEAPNYIAEDVLKRGMIDRTAKGVVTEPLMCLMDVK